MRILFVYGVEVTLGGHFKSGQALAKGLGERGHQIVVWVRSRRNNAYLAGMQMTQSEVLCYPLAPGRSRLVKGFISALMLLHLAAAVVRKRIDVIHCQDIALLRYLVWIAKVLKRRLVLTLAGGEYVDVLHPASVPLIVYSEELREAYLKNERCDAGKIHYIAERIDSTVYHRADVGDRERRDLGVPSRGHVAFTAIRINESKRPWLDNLFGVAKTVDQRGATWTFVVAGDGEQSPEMVERACRVNADLRNVSLAFIGAVRDGDLVARWLNAADVVIGNGRSLMEALSCETLSIILGENGEAELLDNHNITEVMHYNFSGRHFRHRSAGSRSLVDTFTVLESMLARDAGQQPNIPSIPPRLLDHRVGAEKLEKVYQDTGVLSLSLVECLRWEKMRREEYRRRQSVGGS